MSKGNIAQKLSGGCLALFGLPFLAAGLFMSWVYFAGYVKWWRAQGWQEVACRIESAELKVSRGDDGNNYKALATYQYGYGGHQYHGDQVTLNSVGDNMGGFQQKTHRELSRHVVKRPAEAEAGTRPGSAGLFRCYVNPANPGESVLYRELRWQTQGFLAMFVLSFPAVGAGLVLGGLIGTRIARRENALRDQYPGQPWKWKSAWADNTIPETTTLGNRALYWYTLWAGLVILPLILATAASGAFQRERSAWWLLVFVVLWAIPGRLSLKRLRHRAAAGATFFEPAHSPAWPGGLLEGSILLAKPLPPRCQPELRLVCEKKVTRGTGDDRSTTVETIWSHQQSVPQEWITRDPAGFRLPVKFVLPADAPESESTRESATQHGWKLEFTVPGTAIAAGYEVPVFRTAQSPALDAPASVRAGTISDEVAVDLPALLAARRIQAEFASDGTPRSIICPAARNRSLIVFLVLFDAVWTGVAVVLLKQHAPLIFCVVWPLSAAAIWLSVIWQLLHRRVVTFSGHGLEVRNQLGPVVWTRVLEKKQISGFSSATNMSSGQTSFYRVWLTEPGGKQTTLVDGITESTTAGVLVKRLEAWQKAQYGPLRAS